MVIGILRSSTGPPVNRTDPLMTPVALAGPGAGGAAASAAAMTTAATPTRRLAARQATRRLPPRRGPVRGDGRGEPGHHRADRPSEPAHPRAAPACGRLAPDAACPGLADELHGTRRDPEGRGEHRRGPAREQS